MQNIKAELTPLVGKYYNTKINIKFNNRNYELELNEVEKIYKPSDREVTEDPEFEICDSHFESQDVYELAKIIVNKLNKN
jgi:hypothetical protein